MQQISFQNQLQKSIKEEFHLDLLLIFFLLFYNFALKLRVKLKFFFPIYIKYKEFYDPNYLFFLL